MNTRWATDKTETSWARIKREQIACAHNAATHHWVAKMWVYSSKLLIHRAQSSEWENSTTWWSCHWGNRTHFDEIWNSFILLLFSLLAVSRVHTWNIASILSSQRIIVYALDFDGIFAIDHALSLRGFVYARWIADRRNAFMHEFLINQYRWRAIISSFSIWRNYFAILSNWIIKSADIKHCFVVNNLYELPLAVDIIFPRLRFISKVIETQIGFAVGSNLRFLIHLN